MKWALTGALASLLAVGAAACTELASAPVAETAELQTLQVRARELQRGVAATGQLSPDMRIALRQLTADIHEWNTRTGRNDIAVSTTRMGGASASGAADVSAAVAVTPSGPAPCLPCPPVKTSGDKICFLFEGNGCDVQRGLTLQVCAYICINLGTGATPIKRG